MRPRLRSIRLRLTLWYTAALALIVVAFSAAVYFSVRRSLLGHAAAQLERDAAILRNVVADNLDELHEIEEHGTIAYFELFDGRRAVLESADWRKAVVDPAREARTHGARSRWHSPSERTFLLKTESVAAAGRESTYLPGVVPGQPLELTVGVDLAPVEQGLKSLLLTLFVGAPCAIAAAVAGGYFLAGRVLSPVGAIASKAAQITGENLGERLPVENPHDELGQLATVFNDTLARIQDAFDRLRRFTTDASHQLRTPLAAIRSVGEVALRDEANPAPCREVIGSILEEVDRLTRLVDGLLVLTRGDLSRTHVRREELDVAGLAHEVVELLRVLAEEKRQSLSFVSGGAVLTKGDRATLRQCLLNLLDNAIKYTPAGGEVRVIVCPGGDGASPVVEVADTGRGIAAEHQGRVFERFFRVESAAPTAGAGLGLAIARWAAEVNGGRIELESAPGRGSTFRVVLQKGGE